MRTVFRALRPKNIKQNHRYKNRSAAGLMLKQLDCSFSVSIDFDGWLWALPLANYLNLELTFESLPENQTSVWRK